MWAEYPVKSRVLEMAALDGEATSPEVSFAAGMELSQAGDRSAPRSRLRSTVKTEAVEKRAVFCRKLVPALLHLGPNLQNKYISALYILHTHTGTHCQCEEHLVAELRLVLCSAQ